MPFPFGVSVGDFIVCIDLIKTVIESLQDAHGSGDQYRGLLRSLQSLESALVLVRNVKAYDLEAQTALHRAAIQCRTTLSKFLEKIEKYHPSLKLGGSVNSVKDSIRKIQWALYAKEDIAVFQAEISGHNDSIMMLLHTVQISNIEAVHLHIEEAVRLQNAERRTSQMLVYVGLMHCATELRGVARAIVLANIALFHAVLQSARAGWGVPKRLGMGEVVLEDAFGRLIEIPTCLISDWTIFDAVLRHKFAKDFELPSFARCGQYVLRYLPSYQEVRMGTAYSCAFRHGSRLMMTLIMLYDDDCAYACPRCRKPDHGIEDETKPCTCGVVYTRAKCPQSQIIIRPAHATSSTGLVCHQSQSSVHVDVIHPSQAPTFGPSETPAHGDEEHTCVATFDTISNIKNVDFPHPLMVSVTDLLGYAYCVPWRIVQSVEGLCYFLENFTAGGSLFHWPDDYTIREDEAESEILPETWISRPNPGIALTIRLRDSRQSMDVHLSFASKIKAVVLTSVDWQGETDVTRLVEKACLEFGASDSHAEFRFLIEDSVASLWPPSHHCPP